MRPVGKAAGKAAGRARQRGGLGHEGAGEPAARTLQDRAVPLAHRASPRLASAMSRYDGTSSTEPSPYTEVPNRIAYCAAGMASSKCPFTTCAAACARS